MKKKPVNKVTTMFTAGCFVHEAINIKANINTVRCCLVIKHKSEIGSHLKNKSNIQIKGSATRAANLDVDAFVYLNICMPINHRLINMKVTIRLRG